MSNGNYVVSSANWSNGVAAATGAATWVNGSTGLPSDRTHFVSANNSLVGSKAYDYVGSSATPLSNGNYVVISSNWSNGVATAAGAATWVNGSTGLPTDSTHFVSANNSLVGSKAGDLVGAWVTPLSNGNYVVISSNWNNGAATAAGAVTWGNGSNGPTGAVSPSNSLVGTTYNDNIGAYGVTALTNGNYVVASPHWCNTADAAYTFYAGAATWADGSSGVTGPISASNSLVGTNTGDNVGRSVTALTNGNYVVRSPYWNNVIVGAPQAGAATWANGSTGVIGVISATNSLVGTAMYDDVGIRGVTALSNGNYVVASRSNYGTATWANGGIGLVGTILASYSLTFTAAYDDSNGSGGVIHLANGNYVVSSYRWNNGAAINAGAVTWANGALSTSGSISPSNSLVGSTTNDYVGEGEFAGDGNAIALSDGNYVVVSPHWHNGAVFAAGAISLVNGRFRSTGEVQSWNSVLGGIPNGGSNMVFAYDPTRQQLAVGRPAENIVSLFTMDQIFADSLE